jgi:hypothetical protein
MPATVTTAANATPRERSDAALAAERGRPLLKEGPTVVRVNYILGVVLQRSAHGSASDAPASMVARVALIINSFDRAGMQLRLDQVVTRTGLPRSSAHRILTQLHAAGLLQHGPDGYRLAASSLPVTRVVDHSQLRGVASPVLKRLQTDTALVVHLGVLIGTDVVYLDKVAGSSAVAVPTRVAGRTPAHASAQMHHSDHRRPRHVASGAGTDPIPTRPRLRRPRARVGPVQHRRADRTCRRRGSRSVTYRLDARAPAAADGSLRHTRREGHIGASRKTTVSDDAYGGGLRDGHR